MDAAWRADILMQNGDRLISHGEPSTFRVAAPLLVAPSRGNWHNFGL